MERPVGSALARKSPAPMLPVVVVSADGLLCSTFTSMASTSSALVRGG